MLVGKSSDMMAGCPAYMKAWRHRPMVTASTITTAFLVSNMGKAKNGQVAPVIAPTR
ncbi:hypothetical protein D3C73_1472760 [compost metagenome]